MKNSTAAFQHTLAVSCVMHALIFGSAFAFAQYTGGFFRGENTAITVTLVSGGGGDARRPGRETSSPVPVSSLHTPPPALPMNPEHLPEPVDAPVNETGLPAGGRADAGAEAGQGAGTGDTGSAAAGHSDGGAGALTSEQWRLLYSAIEQVKTYPRLARERGIEGTVVVRFKVRPSGSVETVNIVKSSGAQVLDDASVRTVYQARPMPYVQGWVEVPMSYVLK